jgi:hypothetical protein
LSFAEASSNLAEFAAPHETTTTSPVTVSVEPSRSITTSVTGPALGVGVQPNRRRVGEQRDVR